MLLAISKGMWAVKLLRQNPPVLNWGYQLMRVVLWPENGGNNNNSSSSSSESFVQHTDACSLFMVALWNRADHYIFMLWFVLSSFFLSFFSSPNLSRRRLDVCHTSTHGVALVRI